MLLQLNTTVVEQACLFRDYSRLDWIWIGLPKKNLWQCCHKIFTGPMPFLLTNQQNQSTEGICDLLYIIVPRNECVVLITGIILMYPVSEKNQTPMIFWNNFVKKRPVINEQDLYLFHYLPIDRGRTVWWKSRTTSAVSIETVAPLQDSMLAEHTSSTVELLH